MIAAVELQAAMIARLRNDQALTAVLGGQKIYDDLPRGQKPPYVLIAKTVYLDWSTGTESGFEHDITFDIWSDENGRRQTIEIADALRQALDDLPKQLPSQSLINLTFESLEIEHEAKRRLFKGMCSFRAVTEVTA